MLLLMFAAACSDSGSDVPEKPAVPKLVLHSDAEVMLSDKVGEFTVTFTTDKAWTITSDKPWCKPSQKQGAEGKASVPVDVEENADYSSRTAMVTIAAGSVKKTVKVTQAQHDAIVLAKEVYQVDGFASTLNFKVQANVDFAVEVKASWLKQVTDKSRALKEYPLSFDIEANATGKERQAEIVFTKGELKQVVKVVQEPKGAQRFVLTHTLKTFVIPTFTGNDLVATILWGDDQKEGYKPDAAHTYAAEGDHVVTVELQNAEEVSLKNLEGITSIDLSSF